MPMLTELSLAGLSRRLLWLMLVATAIWPLLPGWLDQSMQPPFGLRVPELALVAGAGFVAYLIGVAQRDGYGRIISDGAFTLVAVLSFSAVLGVIMEESSNSFFTAAALYEGLAALLGTHMIAMLLRKLAGDGTGIRTVAQRFVDVVLTGTAMCLLVFWILATMRLHVAASIVLAGAGGSYILVIAILAQSVGGNVKPLAATRDSPRSLSGEVLQSPRGPPD